VAPREIPHPQEPEHEAALFARRQQEHLEREAYPRRHWAQVHDAYAGMHRRLTASVGPWTYDPALLTVTHHSRRYQIDLEQLTTPAALLDVLLQVATKSAGKSDALAALVALLEAVSEEVFQRPLREVFCPSDPPYIVQWPKARDVPECEDEAR
jgi:hypothetical protein